MALRRFVMIHQYGYMFRKQCHRSGRATAAISHVLILECATISASGHQSQECGLRTRMALLPVRTAVGGYQ